MLSAVLTQSLSKKSAHTLHTRTATDGEPRRTEIAALLALLLPESAARAFVVVSNPLLVWYATFFSVIPRQPGLKDPLFSVLLSFAEKSVDALSFRSQQLFVYDCRRSSHAVDIDFCEIFAKLYRLLEEIKLNRVNRGTS